VDVYLDYRASRKQGEKEYIKLGLETVVKELDILVEDFDSFFSLSSKIGNLA
jgi:hypothetical protein